MKKCTKCGEVKATELFSKAGKWRRHECKKCELAYQRARRKEFVIADPLANAEWQGLSVALGMRVIQRKKKERGGVKRPVIGTCIRTGKETRFEGVRQVDMHGFTHPNVLKVLAGKLATHKKHTWRYDEQVYTGRSNIHEGSGADRRRV